MSKVIDNDTDSADDEDCPEYGLFSGEQFDYGAFFERIRAGQGSAKDHEEFTVRAMQMFCLQAWRNEKPDKWLLHYFADQFLKILNGGAWCDELPLPWIPQNEIWARAEKQGLSIYCDVENARRANPTQKMESLLLKMADKHKKSYETVRGEYYKWRKKFQEQKKNNSEA